MKEIITVDNYNIMTMTAKNWNFIVGCRKVNKTMAKDALRLGLNVTAKWKEKAAKSASN